MDFKGENVKWLMASYLGMILVMFILPFFSLDNYSIISHSTSHLAAQNTPNAWVMNLIFVSLGITSIVAGWSCLRNYWFHKIVLLVFGISLIGTAWFQHAPIDPALDFDLKEDYWHSVFANVVGWSFTTFAVATSFIAKKNAHRVFAVGVAILASGLSLLMFRDGTEVWKGIWQRLLFITAFGWMIYAFSYYQFND